MWGKAAVGLAPAAGDDVYTVYMSATKDRIFAAARRLFDEQGPEGLSMRKIAEAVELTPMAIYRHFADKEALLDALMLDGFSVWEARVRAISAKEPMQWLGALSEAFLDFALKEPRRYEAAFLLPARKARRYPDDFVAGRSPVISSAYTRLDKAKANGILGDYSAAEIALAFSALAQGLVSMYQAGRFVSEAEFRAAYRRATRHCILSFAPAQETKRKPT